MICVLYIFSALCWFLNLPNKNEFTNLGYVMGFPGVSDGKESS